MMTSMSSAYSPHPPGIQQHPGVAPGHPMAPSHPQQAGGQPGPVIPQQIHMGVSGPGAQVSQAGAMLGVIPPGVGGPTVPGPHAMQHLNPNQAQIYQHQQAQMAFNNPQMQIQQQLLQQQQHRQAAAARQAMMQQYGSGMPINMPNGMATPMNPAQFNAIRTGGPNMRPVALNPHLHQQQQAAQMGLDQQQVAQQAQQQQMIAQQMALQQQASAAQANANPGQPSQMGPQQIASLQNAHIAAQQHQVTQQQQQPAAVAAAQQNQAQTGQSQPQSQQPQQQPQQQQPQQQPPQQSVQAAALMNSRSRDQIKGNCVLRLLQFGDHLSQFGEDTKQQGGDLSYWSDFVEQFFSPRGVLRHSVLVTEQSTSKQYEVTFPALARYFYTHFESGIKNIQMITEKPREKELPNNYHFVECQKSSFIYWFDNGSQLVAKGHLRAQFDSNQKIELLEFITTNHEEFVPRPRIIEAVKPILEWIAEWTKVNSQPDGKQSPEMNKKGKARPMKSPQSVPPDIKIPESRVKYSIGITPSVSQFLELAEVMGQMNPLFQFFHQHSNLTPHTALNQYVAQFTANSATDLMQPGQRTPSLSQFSIGQSPPVTQLGLPDNNSAIVGSPAQGHMKAPGLQQSQQGTSSGGLSANTSPNATNKRRRPSVKVEGDEAATAVGQANGVHQKVKPSPRMPKRQKANPP